MSKKTKARPKCFHGEVWINPDRMGWQLCIAGTRILVTTIVSLFDKGCGAEKICESYPGLVPDDITIALRFRKPVSPPKAAAPKAHAPSWTMRMFVEEIATRIRSAMEEKNLSLFELAAKLRWTPARLLQWLDGSLAKLPGLEVEDADGGTLRELVQIGLALDKQWVDFNIGKSPMKVGGK